MKIYMMKTNTFLKLFVCAFSLWIMSFGLWAKTANVATANAETTNVATTHIATSNVATSKIKTVEQELTENKTLINKLKQQMSAQQLKESEAMKILAEVEAELNLLLKSVTEAEIQIANGEKELAILQASMNSLNTSFQEKLTQFSKQMKAAYLFNKSSPMKLFLSQQNPAHIDRLLHYYYYMQKQNYAALSQLLNEMHTLSVHQNEVDAMTAKVKELKEAKLVLVESQKAQKEQHRKKLSAIKKDLAQTAAALAVSQQNEKSLISQLAKIQALMAEASSEASNTSGSSNALNTAGSSNAPNTTGSSNAPNTTGSSNPPTNSSNNSSKNSSYKNHSILPFFQPRPFTKAQGKLLWPIRKDPRPSLMSPFMIKAQEGESVLAIYEGRVVFADRLRGFGLLMIVDHGEGYMSLYGQNQTLYKNVGDKVKRGDMIARVGARGDESSGAVPNNEVSGNKAPSSESRDSGLYFEIRKNGKPTNLVNWFN